MPSETASGIHCAELRAEMVRATIARGEEVAVKVIAHTLYALTIVQDPDEPEDRRLHRKARLERIARMAVALISEANERNAEREAKLALDSMLTDAELLAKQLDETHSEFRYLISPAIERVRFYLSQVKPSDVVLDIYRNALTGGAQ